jgi:hypothetical protein
MECSAVSSSSSSPVKLITMDFQAEGKNTDVPAHRQRLSYAL